MPAFVAPEFEKTAFNCPLCGAYAHQQWYEAAKLEASGISGDKCG